MARPIKQGIDYFPVDVGFLQDIKIRKITRACGISAIPILLSLLISIFRDEGYYVGWDDEMSFLIADSVGVSEGAVIETVNKAVQVDFFNANMFNTYGILTSAGIQRRFFKAVERRKEVCYDARFLLISENVSNNPINVSNNSRNAYDNQQSKVKERKEKESKVKKSKIQNQSSIFSTMISDYTANEDLIESLNDFIAMRYEIKKPLTQRALEIMLKKLTELSGGNDNTKIKILENSVMNSWQGIFALKNEHSNAVPIKSRQMTVAEKLDEAERIAKERGINIW